MSLLDLLKHRRSVRNFLDKPVEREKPTAPEGGPDGRGEKQQIKPAEKKPVAPEGGREKKDKKKPAELVESPQKDKKKQGAEEPER